MVRIRFLHINHAIASHAVFADAPRIVTPPDDIVPARGHRQADRTPAHRGWGISTSNLGIQPGLQEWYLERHERMQTGILPEHLDAKHGSGIDGT
jgi:hypothetical protein